jgi:hypothetical protein
MLSKKYFVEDGYNVELIRDDSQFLQTVYETLKKYENLPYHTQEDNPVWYYYVSPTMVKFELQQPAMKKYVLLWVENANTPMLWKMWLSNYLTEGVCNNITELNNLMKIYGQTKLNKYIIGKILR